MGDCTMLPRGCCFGNPGLEQGSPLRTQWVTLESSLCLSELIVNSSSLPHSPNLAFRLLTYPSISYSFQGVLFQSMWICSSSHLSFWYPYFRFPNIPKDASTFVISINPLPFTECPLWARKQMRRTQNPCLVHLVFEKDVLHSLLHPSCKHIYIPMHSRSGILKSPRATHKSSSPVSLGMKQLTSHIVQQEPQKVRTGKSTPISLEYKNVYSEMKCNRITNRMKLETIIQSEVTQKDKDQYSILMHIYRILKDGNDNPICKTEKETQMYRTDF